MNHKYMKIIINYNNKNYIPPIILRNLDITHIISRLPEK